MWNKIRDAVSRDAAFYPPRPPTYAVVFEEYKEPYIRLHGSPGRHGHTCHLDPLRVTPYSVAGTAGDLSCVWLPARVATRRTLLVSHGNAVDLGDLLPMLSGFRDALGCNITSWDYGGYGASAGSHPAASSLATDGARVFTAVLAHRGIDPSDVVLYGQSLGSFPTCSVAASSPGVAGVVLHSAMASGLRVLFPRLGHWPSCLDLFTNRDLVPKIKAPILFVHGTHDEVVHRSQAVELLERAQKPAEPFWATDRGHDDVELDPRYLPTLKTFLEACWSPK